MIWTLDLLAKPGEVRQASGGVGQELDGHRPALSSLGLQGSASVPLSVQQLYLPLSTDQCPCFSMPVLALVAQFRAPCLGQLEGHLSIPFKFLGTEMIDSTSFSSSGQPWQRACACVWVCRCPLTGRNLFIKHGCPCL